MAETLSHVEHGIVDLYSFEGIASDSTKVRESLAGGCELPVHEVRVHLRDELARLKANILEQLGLTEIQDLVDKANEHKVLPARGFHESIAKIFRQLNDAHTLYLPPWARNLPLFVYTPSGSSSQASFGKDESRSNFVQLRLRLEQDDSDPSQSAEAPVPLVEMRVATGLVDTPRHYGPWIEVEMLEDQRAFDYLLAEADENVGSYKSQGARLNAIMNYWGRGLFPGILPLPQTGSLQYRLKNVSDAGMKIPELLEQTGTLDVIVLSSNITSLESFQEHIHSNPNWEIIEDFLDTHFRANRTQAGQSLARLWSMDAEFSSEELLMGWEGRMRRVPSQPNDPLLTAKTPANLPDRALRAIEQRQLQNSVEEIGHVPHIVDPIYIAYRLPDAVVLKITSFMPSSESIFPPPFNFLFCMMDLIRLYRRTVEVAIAQNSDRLILDLTDNGGGIVEIANLLTLLVAPRHDTDVKLCAEYGVQMHKFWGKWLASFGGRFDEVIAGLEHESDASLEERFRRLKHLELLHDATNGVQLPVDIEEVDHFLEDLANATSKQEKRRLLKEALESRGAWLDEGDLMGDNTSQGWFPFTGDVEDPSTGEPFDPPTKPYVDQEVHDWGVTGNKNYTKRYMFACSMPWNPVVSLLMWFLGASITRAKHQWKEIAVLTNGLCGSACSLFASQIQFKEGAAVFTYGGVPGQLLDSSAFAGGNVEDYRRFWPQVLHAALVGDIFYGPDTPIGQMLRAEGEKELGYSRTLLLPLPTKALARFNYNMMFVPELGPEALPREWYVIAGHHNFMEWHATSAKDSSSWTELYGIYGKIAEMNWSAVRADISGHLKASGISYSCAAEPPTTPFIRETDWDIYVWPVLIPFLLCCCACCGLCCKFCFCRYCAPTCCPCCFKTPKAEAATDETTGPAEPAQVIEGVLLPSGETAGQEPEYSLPLLDPDGLRESRVKGSL